MDRIRAWSTRLHVRLIELSINFVNTEDNEKLFVILTYLLFISKFLLIYNIKNPYFVQLTSQSDRLIAINWVRSIKVNQVQNSTIFEHSM
jgi:hypothetical protein